VSLSYTVYAVVQNAGFAGDAEPEVIDKMLTVGIMNEWMNEFYLLDRKITNQSSRNAVAR